MTTPRIQRRHPTYAAQRLVAAMPDEWLDQDQISELCVAEKIGHRRPLEAILNEMRRRSWLTRQRAEGEPTLYKRTPTGARAAGQINSIL